MEAVRLRTRLRLQALAFRLCADMVGRLPELGHIDLDRVQVSFIQARKRVRHGLWASLGSCDGGY